MRPTLPDADDRREGFLRFVAQSLMIRAGEFLSVTAIKGKKKDAVLRNLTTRDHGECWSFLEGLNRAGFNCYVTTSPLTEDPGPYRRGSGKLCPERRALLIDLDPMDSREDAETLHHRVVEALPGVRLTRVFSGRGHQVLACLSPEAAERTRAIIQGPMAALVGDLQAVVDPSTFDPSRLCRAPGFVHQGTGERARVLEWPDPDLQAGAGWEALLVDLPLNGGPGGGGSSSSRRPRAARPRASIPTVTRRQLAPVRRLIMEPSIWPACADERQALRRGLVGMLRRQGLSDSQILAVVDHEAVEPLLASTSRRAAEGRPYTGAPTVRRILGVTFLRTLSSRVGTITGSIGLPAYLEALPSRGIRLDKEAALSSGHARRRRFACCGRWISAAMAKEFDAGGEQVTAYARTLVCETALCATCWPRRLQAAGELARETMPKAAREVLELLADEPHPLPNHTGCLRVSYPTRDGRWRVLYVAPDKIRADQLRAFAWAGLGRIEKLSQRRLIVKILEAQLAWHHDLAEAGEGAGDLLDRTTGIHLVQNPRKGGLHWPTRTDIRERIREQIEAEQGALVDPAEVSHHELRRTADAVVIDRGPHPFGIAKAIAVQQRLDLGLHRVPLPPSPQKVFGLQLPAGFG